uniref:ABC transporter permease n=1 Tax=Dipterocladia arabiensis TaxID=2007176 RepID=A0A1Z1M046_9FLOR|nr:hypothetical protein [Dipterocladia arabiensis]ARW59319.1 hypothetical protein [Dipterocladia arabiensis]
MRKFLEKIYIILKIMFNLFSISNICKLNSLNLLRQMQTIIPACLPATMITSCFMSLVFSLQIVKEFLYLNASDLVGSVLTIIFLRELSPVLTSIILIGKIGSYFTAELATMKITEQIDVLYILNINPISYLVIPRILAFIIILPLLNCLSLLTSLSSSSFICFILYNIHPKMFFLSVLTSLSYQDLIKSCLKTIIFALFISTISCVWGLTSQGGAKGVGESITKSVVISLLSVLCLDFILSYYMFNSLDSVLKSL